MCAHTLVPYDLTPLRLSAAPSTEEGNDIAQSAVPYQHPSYWDYTLR